MGPQVTGHSPPLPDSPAARSNQETLRILLDRIARTDPLLGDRSVHAARKTMKRARAILRLMRAAIGDTAYRRANRQLRDAARPLRALRDAAVLLTVLAKLIKPSDKSAFKAYVKRLHYRLQRAHGAARQRLTRKSCREIAEKVRILNRQTLILPARLPDAPSVRRGIVKTYKSGREAFARTRQKSSNALLHEWRKQAKHLANELELAQDLLQPPLKEAHRRASRVASALGDDHDLALLSGKLREWETPRQSAAAVRHLERLEHRIKARRRRLQAKAQHIGRTLYGEPARRFDATVKEHLI